MGVYKLRDKERSKEGAYVSYRIFQNTPQKKVLTFPTGFLEHPSKENAYVSCRFISNTPQSKGGNP